MNGLERAAMALLGRTSRHVSRQAREAAAASRNGTPKGFGPQYWCCGDCKEDGPITACSFNSAGLQRNYYIEFGQRLTGDTDATCCEAFAGTVTVEHDTGCVWKSAVISDCSSKQWVLTFPTNATDPVTLVLDLGSGKVLTYKGRQDLWAPNCRNELQLVADVDQPDCEPIPCKVCVRPFLPGETEENPGGEWCSTCEAIPRRYEFTPDLSACGGSPCDCDCSKFNVPTMLEFVTYNEVADLCIYESAQFDDGVDNWQWTFEANVPTAHVAGTIKLSGNCQSYNPSLTAFWTVGTADDDCLGDVDETATTAQAICTYNSTPSITLVPK